MSDRRGKAIKTVFPKEADTGLYRLKCISTTDFDRTERFDAWRETAYSVVDLEAPRLDEADLFAIKRSVHGETGVFASQEGSEHRTLFSRSASLSGAGDVVVISMMPVGELGLEGPGGALSMAPHGRLAAYDATRPMRYHRSAGREIYLLLPRAKALGALGGRIPGLFLLVDTIPLGVMVRDQMLALDRHAEHLEPKELAAALDAIHALALLLLQRIGRELNGSGEADANALFLAAKHYIQSNYQMIDLSPEAVARALGCSRSTLYRAFTLNDVTIMDTVRDVRLAMSRKLIEAATGRSISVIAYECGFKDPSSFGRMFRSRFGVSPSEWRDQFR
ncbi:helix-turn-helix transcriptional regulator [Ancylobacter rudongensis]|uniref:AraC-type DNA-binding protein n=1 Tax=Ancylobacter rudongensis TaxID=177413 RepID=A0A1G4SYW1_9HYPH|nr:AraC family transcriptional regulator [Ancylobacter rudongensis]SCW74251.1 AraC-type DNA-binding protein [Ancylobacter rudongensis]